MLIEYSHKNLSEKDCREALDHYKKEFEKDDFDLFLYDYYRKKGFKFETQNKNLLIFQINKKLN